MLTRRSGGGQERLRLRQPVRAGRPLELARDRVHALGEGPDQSEQLTGVAAALKPRDWATRYDLACAWSRAGQRKPALLELERAVEFGFKDGEHMAKDDDLKGLRSDPRFHALLALLRAAPAPAP